jgi:hypothetical protein
MGGGHMGGATHFHGGFAHSGGFHSHSFNHVHFGFGHVHYGPNWGFYGYYAPYYYPWFSLSFGPAYYSSPAPVYYYSSPVISTYATAPATIVTQSSPAEKIPAPRADLLPAPTESSSFRYDGDRPAAPPVERIPPARDLDVPKLPELPAPPPAPRLGPSPSDMAVAVPATSVTKKYTYSAYGEDRLTKPGPRDDKTVLIRRDK